MEGTPPRLAFFVSPHGYGHAARSSAVMAALHRKSGAEFELYTTVPQWFFEESIKGLFRYHHVTCDVGFVQTSALSYDLRGTVEALQDLLPFEQALVDDLAARVLDAGCSAVVCDIAALGIAVAERAGLPSVLIESFSWQWLYEPLHDRAPELERFSGELRHWWRKATVHVQTEPLCWRDDSVETLVDPISRAPRLEREQARLELDIAPDARVVVITMGGYREGMPFLERLQAMSDVVFIVTGASETARYGNLMLFSSHDAIFMPNLLRAADALVAKLGYGIIAEAWSEGLPFAFVSRRDFREMPPLEAFVRRELLGFEIAPEDFAEGGWIDRVPELLDLPRRPRAGSGADDVANAVSALLVREGARSVSESGIEVL